RLELIADSAGLDGDLRRAFCGDPAAHRADHRPTRSARGKPASWASTKKRRACAWHTPTASASAASAPGRAASFRSVRIMCATWNFSAAPEPTTASLTARGAYSNTGVPAGTAHSAAPRACPSFRALSTLRLSKTRSTATSPGWCVEKSSCRPSRISRRRAAGAAAVRFRQPCATAMSCVPRHSITPKPVRREPGSRPRMRTLMAGVNGAAAAAGSKARQDLVRYLDIRINVPYLVELFQGLEQVNHPLRRLARELHGNRRALRHFRGRWRKSLVRQHRAHRRE